MPQLRDDLELIAGPRSAAGAPTWTIYDPLRNRHFRIGHTAFEILGRWSMGDADRIVRDVERRTPWQIGSDDIETLVEFLHRNELVTDPTAQGAQRLHGRKVARRQHWLMWLLKNYLFIRVPLVRPDGFLGIAAPWVSLFFARPFWLATLAAGILGVVLAVRQWDVFLQTFIGFLSWQGALALGAALLGAKIVHELGHALAAKRAGCTVPSMGVAFLILWPVLYTDVTDAWRLRSRKDRLRIGAAGIAAELAIAMWATLAWSFLPDGPLRSAAFMLATVTWVTTLLINLSPFMRFDGYYLLSDALGVQNLQDRSFAIGRWRLRRTLFGFELPRPERFPPGLERWLVIYAYATWTWRFFLFLAIALLVYHLFFKLLGLFLMVVELAWFIGRPIVHEVQAWWRLRDELRPTRNALLTLSCLGALIAVLVVPWQAHVTVPGIVEARQTASIHAPVSARLLDRKVGAGSPARAGDTLFTLASPALASEMQRVRHELEALQHQIARRAADRELSSDIGVLEGRLAEMLATLRGLRQQAARLAVVAPIDGTVADVADDLHPGRWLGAGMLLARIVDRDRSRIVAYVRARDLNRLTGQARARVYPSGGAPAFDARIEAIETVNLEVLERPWLASVHGGPLHVQPDADGRLVPAEPRYRVFLAPVAPMPAPASVMVADIRIDADARSPVAPLWRAVVAVLIRESGF